MKSTGDDVTFHHDFLKKWFYETLVFFFPSFFGKGTTGCSAKKKGWKELIISDEKGVMKLKIFEI